VTSPIKKVPRKKAPPTPERGRAESSRAYRAFCVYRDLGPHRSLDRAWKSSCSATDQGDDTGGTSSRHPGCWGTWSQKFNWVERAEAHDDEIEEQRSKFECEAQTRTEDRVRNQDALLDKMSTAAMNDGKAVKFDPATNITTTTTLPGFRPREFVELTRVRNETTKRAIHGFGDGQIEKEPPENRIVKIISMVPDKAHDKCILSAKVDKEG
jgi:hypothetical protein